MSCVVKASIVSTVLLLAATALADPIQSLTQGPPSHHEQLSESSYHTVPVRRPAHARLLIVNLDALESMGIEIPEDARSPQFEEEVEKQVHWVIPDTQDESEFGPGSSEAHPTLYFGIGIGPNFGDGRAMTKGNAQIKYSGVTGLAEKKDDDFVHSNGRGALSRALDEIIWGEVGQDFPFGANRVLTVSDRGTWTVWPNHDRVREGLIAREDPLRPAHYAQRAHEATPERFDKNALDALQKLEVNRAQDIIETLPDALPKPKGFDAAKATDAEKMRAGFLEFVDRAAEVKAFEYANRFFHGGSSTSNIELDLKLLDYDTMSAQPSYVTLTNLLGDVFGSKSAAWSDWIMELHQAVRDAPDGFYEGLPSLRELRRRFAAQYQIRLNKNFVELTGLPKDLVAELDGDRGTSKEVQALGEQLRKIAFHGAAQFVFKDEMPSKSTTYDLPRILVSLASQDPLEQRALNEAIEPLLPDSSLRANLVSSYQSLMKSALTVAAKNGVTISALHHYVYENSKIRNADIPDMHRPALRWENIQIVKNYLATGDRQAVEKSVYERAQKSRRVFKSDDPYQLVIMENRDIPNRAITTHVFNARTNRFEIVIRSTIKDGHVSFFGNKLSLDEIRHSALRTSADGWSSDLAPTVSTSGVVEFRIPSSSNPGITELALRSADGSKWWKASDHRNIEISFVQRHSIPSHPSSPDPRNLPALHATSEALYVPPQPDPEVVHEPVHVVPEVVHEPLPAAPSVIQAVIQAPKAPDTKLKKLKACMARILHW